MKSEIIKMLEISTFYLDTQNSFARKKICGMLVIETKMQNF